jgi:hypothetical protein
MVALLARLRVAMLGLSIARTAGTNHRILDVIDPLFALTNQLPELAGDPDDERSSPYPD